jgi:hypothetical protein
MRFNPCLGGENCSQEGTHCSGCGREHGEIRDTRELVKGMVQLARRMNYENPEEFVKFVSDKALRKINPS